jgi:multicomponent Na+:H+ antiporter subunit G
MSGAYLGTLLDVFTYVAVGAGLFFFLAGTVGLLRFPDTLTRLHALTKADNLGLGFIVLGLLPQVDGVANGLKLIAIWVLVLLSSADAGQLIARAARRAMGRGLPR